MEINPIEVSITKIEVSEIVTPLPQDTEISWITKSEIKIYQLEPNSWLKEYNFESKQALRVLSGHQESKNTKIMPKK